MIRWTISRDTEEVPSKGNAIDAAWTLKAVIEAA